MYKTTITIYEDSEYADAMATAKSVDILLRSVAGKTVKMNFEVDGPHKLVAPKSRPARETPTPPQDEHVYSEAAIDYLNKGS